MQSTAVLSFPKPETDLPMNHPVYSLLCVLCLALVGCASEIEAISKADYDQISVGMTRSEVVAIIGEGDESTVPGPADVKTCLWQNTDGSYIDTTFRDGKLVDKSQDGLK